LGNGGRIDRSETFLDPLSRLPKITYDNLVEHWVIYKGNILASVTTVEPAPVQSSGESAVSSDTAAVVDSTAQVAGVDSAAQSGAVVRAAADKNVLLPGQWLTVSNWFERLLGDLTEEAESKKAAVERWFLFFVIFDLLLFSSLYFLFRRYVLQGLATLAEHTSRHQVQQSLPPNELGALEAEVNGILKQLLVATDFVGAIGEGKLDFDYRSLDSTYVTGKNRLADSLISMQQKLKVLNEEEQRRQWANEGLTKFVDILRSSNDSISTLGDKIISALVKYTNANQGGLYVLNDEDEHHKHLELISLFAFDNKKFESQKVKLGEGILGQTFLEKETTLLNDIPEEYVRITSGLGGANPKSLLMVPLKVDKEVYGIVELASFRNFQEHEISFIEKLAETIASTLASVKAAQRNKVLIEQFQQQTEEMRSQEEEMRQNMEELQATQEEISRKEHEYVTTIKQLERDLQLSIPAGELEKLKEEYNRKVVEYQGKIRDLEMRLAQKPAKEDDWAVAEQVEKEFRIQLEAMRIAADERAKGL
ncbi:MAG TPA: GAF domain-containing protein, partial [Chryseosolibacter sp.]|nr:GAF domain-containing protein [Chryseosolibacter sp.]